MKIREFFEMIDHIDALEGVNIKISEYDDPTLDEIVIKNKETGWLFTFGLDGIVGNSREKIEGLLADVDGDPQPLYHYSRIVGYFSRIENWNKSKLGELRDRRAGDYGISNAMIENKVNESEPRKRTPAAAAKSPPVQVV